MKINAIGAISPQEVTSVDILCGRDKRSYNHVANRRFRFLTALNLERYRETESRRAKSVVVQSLYNQIREAGGRFLVKRRQDDYLIQVPDKVAREKISHALRDKFPRSTLRDVKAKLRRGLSPNRFKENPFVTANARLLRVSLPEAQHASDDHVEHILTTELEAMCNQEEAASSTIQMSMMMMSSSAIAAPLRIRPDPVAPNTYESTVNYGSVLNKSPYDTFWKTASTIRNVVGAFDTSTTLVSMRLPEPDLVPSSSLEIRRKCIHVDNDDYDDESSDFEGIGDFDVGEDLPQNFTAKDCQDLVDMLDFATGL